MSYRAYKKLFGETALELKSRLALAIGVPLLLGVSFYVYARQTEGLAYDQLTHTGRTLVAPILTRVHVRGELRAGLDEFQRQAEQTWPDRLKGYQYQILSPDPRTPERQPTADADRQERAAFLTDPARTESSREAPGRAFLYYGAVRAGQSCLACHRDPARSAPAPAAPELQPGDLMAVVRVQLSTEMIEAGANQNLALLAAFCVGACLLILAGSFAVIRYVVVKPVKHLKAVADAIAAGELNVRSEIQTGDEFEDLSDAFNRMLRNLTSTQERNRELIANLDQKVDQLARANMALYESDRLKGDFLSTVSHELRTPLTSIIGFSELLVNLDALTDKQRRWAVNIMTSGQGLLALINDVLDLARLEAGKLKLHPAPLDPAAMCEQAAALIRPAAEAKHLELKVLAPAGLPAVTQDAGKLGQILSNLLGNAVKFTPEGGRVTLAAEAADGWLELTVADTGVGIPPEEQELVFDKFRQASHPLTREQGGTGLGLSIVRELAKLLGGDVTLRSELGRGSRFRVRVPADLPGEPGA
jgi:signal transduction histidine kinase